MCVNLLDFTLGANLELALGADVNLADTNGNTVLIQAYVNGHIDTCDILINLGANDSDNRFKHVLFNSYSKWYYQGQYQRCNDVINYFKHVIDVEFFYRISLLEATKEGTPNEYIDHMDNCFRENSME